MQKKISLLKLVLNVIGILTIISSVNATELAKRKDANNFSQVALQIAQTQHLRLHYPSHLSNKSVNNKCPEDTIDKVVTCLLGGAFIDMVIKSKFDGKPEEVWIVDSQNTHNSVAKNQLVNVDEHNVANDSADLLALAQSEDALERSQAIGNMAVSEISDPILAKKILSDALEDKDPDIRAKAVNSVTKVDNENARSVLLRMLTDKEVSVRLASVVAAYNDEEVLHMAEGDSDEQVRMLAEISLNKLKSQ